MELRHIRHFVAVAEELHFGRAALKLHIEQSPLSRSIKELEKDLGVRLFFRTTRSMSLTQIGLQFFEDAKMILAAMNDAKKRIIEESERSRSALRVAVADNLAQSNLIRLLLFTKHEEPDVDMLVLHLSVSEMAEKISTAEVDIGISLQPSVQGFEAEVMWKDEMVFLVPDFHPLSKMKCPDLSDFTKYPLVISNYDGDEPSYPFRSLLGQVGLKSSNTVAVSSTEALKTLVCSGCGVGLSLRSQLSDITQSKLLAFPVKEVCGHVLTYALRSDREKAGCTTRFIKRAQKLAGD